MNIDFKKGLVLGNNELVLSYLSVLFKECFGDIEMIQVASLREACCVLDSYKPDVALIDMSEPEAPGIDVLDRLGLDAPGCISVVFSSHDHDEYVFSAFRAGAQGYLLKDQGHDSLIKSLNMIKKGHVALAPTVTEKVISSFSRRASQRNNSVQLDVLTARERQILSRIGTGDTIRQIAEEINISHHTVHTYVKSIYKKLDISSRAQAAQKAVQLGLLEN